MEAALEQSPIVILVDDDAAIREALGELLNSVGVDCYSFGSGQALLDADLPDRPGCLVLDVRMPGLSGLDLQRRLGNGAGAKPIIFLTGHGDIAMSVQAMKSGAADFLTKPVRDQTLIDAVTRAIAADVEQRGKAAASRESAALHATLTPRERQVLGAVVRGALNKQIAYDLGISEVTVKLHRSSMMRKMHANSVTQLIHVWQSLPGELRGDRPTEPQS